MLTVASLKLADFLKDHRRLKISKGEAVAGEVIIEAYKKEIEDDHENKPRTELYKRETLIALKKHWPELYSRDISKLTEADCRDWAARFNKQYSAPRFNGALGIVRRIFGITVEQGYRVDNPAMSISRRSVKPKQLNLPTQDQFREMAKMIETSGAAQARDCGALF